MFREFIDILSIVIIIAMLFLSISAPLMFINFPKNKGGKKDGKHGTDGDNIS